MSFRSSFPSLNLSLAQSMGGEEDGRVRILFPFTPAFCHKSDERPSAHTRFRVMEYRKEPRGFRHESIVMKMLDGSICRVERMGDPMARFNALDSQGSVAHDFVQCLKPGEYISAPTDTSEVVATIELPCTMDISLVFTICRAIQEGETTRNYKLFGANCYFFSWAVLCCLTRVLAGFDQEAAHLEWLQELNATIDRLVTGVHQSHPQAVPPGATPSPFIRAYTVLYSNSTEPSNGVLSRVQLVLGNRAPKTRRGLKRVVQNSLWRSTLSLGLHRLMEETIRLSWLQALKIQLGIPDAQEGSIGSRLEAFMNLEDNPTHTEFLKNCCMAVLIELSNTHATSTGVEAPDTGRGIARSSVGLETTDYPKPLSPGLHVPAASTLDYRIAKPMPSKQTLTMSECFLLLVVQIRSVLCKLLDLLLFSFLGILLFHYGAQPHAYTVIEIELERIVSQLESHQTMEVEVPKDFFYELRALQGKSQVVWDSRESVWAQFCEEMGYELPTAPASNLTTNLLQVTAKLEAETRTQSLTVEDFQQLILGRVDEHAALLRRFKIGPFKQLRDQLRDRLSQVWASIRSDGLIDSNNIEGISSSGDDGGDDDDDHAYGGRYPVPGLSTAPSKRYEPYRRQAHSRDWLDALYHWMYLAGAKVEWIDRLERGEGNRAILTLTPVVTCTLYHFPDEMTQQYFRRASHDHRIAAEEARRTVSSWLTQQNQDGSVGNGRKILNSFYYTVYYDPGAGAHAQYIVGDISYTYSLENWTAAECACDGSAKTQAREGAAQMLMEKGYCMIPLDR